MRRRRQITRKLNKKEELLLSEKRSTEMQVSVLAHGISGSLNTEYLDEGEIEMLQRFMVELREAIGARDRAAERWYSQPPRRLRRATAKKKTASGKVKV